MDSSRIRNFSIIAHIDHGKSTLADRFLEMTGSVEKRKMQEQFLDAHPLERERGITIKMAPVRMQWAGFVFNLIDTPGHVDFSYEVSRALAAVEGAILLVDATQGIQAQTLAHLYAAHEERLVIIPVVNKIDLPSADPEKAESELAELLGVAGGDVLRVSGKTGAGVIELLDAVIKKIPAPPGVDSMDGEGVVVSSKPLRALIFDSKYDPYLGVVAHVRIREGNIKKGDPVRFIATGAESSAEEVGVFLPARSQTAYLAAGEIGYIATGIKEPAEVRVGDTITHAHAASGVSPVEALSGYREPEPMVWSSLFPENQDEYESLRESLKKLQLEDAAFTFVPEDAGALGRGFRAGFLGILHMEIVSERLRREYGMRVIFSRPSVSFRVITRSDHTPSAVYAAHMLPEEQEVVSMEEPWVSVEILAPARFLGALTTLIHEREGEVSATVARGNDRIHITFAAPLRKIIVDFYDILKSATQGFASMAYHPAGWRNADLVRLDILAAGERLPALSEIVPSKDAYAVARMRVEKLKELLPRQLFPISIQAAIGARIIARETIPALKKDVTGYLYGGDRTRKMKLWKKQQRGKKRLEESGRVHVSPDIFFRMLGNSRG